MDPLVSDLTLRHGFPLTKTYQLYSDNRLIRWRKSYNLALIYQEGDGVRASDGTAWVALSRVQGVNPLAVGQVQWSKLTPADLTGCTASAVFTPIGAWAGFTIAPTLIVLEGKVTVAVKASDFASAPAPSSTHWYLQVTDPTAVPSEPVSGTAAFREP